VESDGIALRVDTSIIETALQSKCYGESGTAHAAGQLANIAANHLAGLPEAERKARIEAFEKVVNQVRTRALSKP